MKEQLKYWKSLSKQQKAELKAKHGVKVVTFDFINKIYNEAKLSRTE